MGDVAMALLKAQTGNLHSVASNESAVDSPGANEMCTLDSLIKEVATPRTRATLEEYEGQTQVCCHQTSSSLDLHQEAPCLQLWCCKCAAGGITMDNETCSPALCYDSCLAEAGGSLAAAHRQVLMSTRIPIGSATVQL